MERVYERCAALDVHKAQLTACAHVPDRQGKRSVPAFHINDARVKPRVGGKPLRCCGRPDR